MRIRTILPAALLAVSGLLAGAGATFAAGAGEEFPEGGGYPAFQCFKTVDREYCSDTEVENDDGGAAWIGSCPSDVLKNIADKPYLRDFRPEDAFSCSGEEFPEGGGYPAFQCFKTADRDEYCSDKKVKNHDGGADWIASCPSDVQKNINGKPYLRDPRPEDALSCSGEELPEAGGYPAFQCFKTVDRVEYCSDKKVKNHDAGADWIATCPPDVQRSIKGRGYLLEKRPGGASRC